MITNIEQKGYFFLPENPPEQLPGVLKFQQGDGIEVALFGQFSKFGNPGSKEKRIVLGFIENGKKVTLLSCYEVSKSMSVPGFPQSKISAIYIFIGQHYQTISEISFENCSIEYSDLNHWLDISGFDKPMYSEEAKEVTIKYKRPDKISFPLKDDWDGEIEFTFSMPHTYFTPAHKAEIKQTPVLTIKPWQKSSFESFQSILSSFNSFLALNYFAYPVIRSIIFYEPQIKEDEHDPDFIKIELFFNLGVALKKYNEHTSKYDFLLLYKDYQPQFPDIIKKWYSLREKIEASIDILTECFMGRGNPMELHFLSIAQALENLHRRITGKEEILFNRLTEIINELPAKVKEALLGNEIDFARRVTRNRNYYTHYSERHEAAAASLGELFVISEKLKIILIVCILKELSFNDVSIEKIIIGKGVFLFNHLIKINSNAADSPNPSASELQN
ncbi:MAG: hypothetical protein J0I32_04430 [Sphingobacteriales bacterium]|nr:hypothetical protein [Sphingobacteriales bacterium]OJV98405.1 MAG: hypothetical protein BGO52_11495 [Sphingobacteriales bacterium 44-61]